MLTRILMAPDDEATNPTLSGDHLDLLAQHGSQRTLADGETLYRPGDRHENFYVVLDGQVLIVDGDGAAACVLAVQGQGKFLGEYGLLAIRLGQSEEGLKCLRRAGGCGRSDWGWGKRP